MCIGGGSGWLNAALKADLPNEMDYLLPALAMTLSFAAAAVCNV